MTARLNPILRRKHITPHVLPHSCAVALLQSGTDVTVIRDYLGHISIAATGRYITGNPQMKREAMQAFWNKAGIEPVSAKTWKLVDDLGGGFTDGHSIVRTAFAQLRGKRLGSPDPPRQNTCRRNRTRNPGAAIVGDLSCR